MKYLVLSDIHGDYKYCDIAINKFNSFDCDRIIILGDVLYHGPRNDLTHDYNPKKVVELLNQYSDKILCIRGNCDSEVDQMVLKFKIYASAMIEINKKTVNLVHGHHMEYYTKDNEYYLHGHTHVNKVDANKINIGSTSIPKDGIHSYGIIEDGELKVYNLLNDELVYSFKF